MLLLMKRAQSLLETVVLLSVVTLAAVVMFPAVKRGIQSVVKVTADQIGTQEESEQTLKDGAYLVVSQTESDTRVDNEHIDLGYTTTDYIAETTQSNTRSVSQLGFIEEN